ncbi:MAG: glycosyltransferase family 2 protein [Egibacteraceae bacterium]
MTAAGPEVSVVIPTKSRWHTLAVTLPGALGQEGVRHEVIVVDDGSTDETARRLSELRDPRLRVIRHERSRHLVAARNSGIAAARGRWLAFLDDDDLWSPRKLRALLDAAEARGAVFAYSAGLVIDSDRSVLQTWPAPAPDGLLATLLRGNWIPAGGSNPIARTDLVRRLGGFDERLRHFGEWDMWIRLAAAGPAAACAEPLVAYLSHAENMVLHDSRAVVRESLRFVGKHRRCSARYGARPAEVVPDRMGFLRWLGWAHARAGRPIRASGWYLGAAIGSSPYGRRKSLRDARAALLGQIPADRPTPVDPAAVRAASWLTDHPHASA